MKYYGKHFWHATFEMIALVSEKKEKQFFSVSQLPIFVT